MKYRQPAADLPLFPALGQCVLAALKWGLRPSVPPLPQGLPPDFAARKISQAMPETCKDANFVLQFDYNRNWPVFCAFCDFENRADFGAARLWRGTRDARGRVFFV
jgi:hypothetical protein